MSMFMISLVSASIDDLGTFKQNTCVALPQTCGSCTYSNITSILYPNSTIAVSNVIMTKIGTNYNYTFCSTPSLGKYTVNGISDLDGTPTVWAYYFYVTPTGEETNGWKITLQIFTSVSALLLMLLFFYFAGNSKDVKVGPNGQLVKEEKEGLKLLFGGLGLVFLIAHLLITNVILHNTLGDGAITGAYTNIMNIFFILVGGLFLVVSAKVIFSEVSNFQKRRGLK